jgi:hypothetical protein
MFARRLHCDHPASNMERAAKSRLSARSLTAMIDSCFESGWLRAPGDLVDSARRAFLPSKKVDVPDGDSDSFTLEDAGISQQRPVWNCFHWKQSNLVYRLSINHDARREIRRACNFSALGSSRALGIGRGLGGF